MGREARNIDQASDRPATAWLLLVAMAATACDGHQPPQPGTPSTASADEVPFVVFVEPKLVIEGVGATTSVPAAVGSTVSAQTLTSSDPRVVEVTSGGELRARSAGRATVRATGNASQVLEVEVRESPAPRPEPRSDATLLAVAPNGPLSVSPSAAELRLGQVTFFEVMAGGHRFQPTWQFIGPALLQQTAPSGFVATAVGKTRLCASNGTQVSCCAIAISR